MKKQLHLLISCTVVLFLFSSCASVFEGRNYGHLNYVKAKKQKTDQHEASAPDEISAMSPDTEPMADQEETIPPSVTQEAPESNEEASEKRSAADFLKGFSPNTFPHRPWLDVLSPGKIKSQEDGPSLSTKDLFPGMDPTLRLGLIFIIAGIIVALFAFIPEVGFIFGIAGAILVIIGLVYILMYLVENG